MSGATGLMKLARRAAPAEPDRCELCGAPIGAGHRHVLELATRDVKCACRPCGLLFDRADRLKLIPTDVRAVDDVFDDAAWEDLRLPVDIAFFFRAGGEWKAYYPGPMGPTESLLRVDVPVELADDVEALLVNRGGRRQWIVPIDVCYELVGLIRAYWRGFTGGAEVWRRLDAFWARLDAR